MKDFSSLFAEQRHRIERWLAKNGVPERDRPECAVGDSELERSVVQLHALPLTVQRTGRSLIHVEVRGSGPGSAYKAARGSRLAVARVYAR
jgi:hypothetical protein